VAICRFTRTRRHKVGGGQRREGRGQRKTGSNLIRRPTTSVNRSRPAKTPAATNALVCPSWELALRPIRPVAMVRLRNSQANLLMISVLKKPSVQMPARRGCLESGVLALVHSVSSRPVADVVASGGGLPAG